jgi:hypothetical protein
MPYLPATPPPPLAPEGDSGVTRTCDRHRGAGRVGLIAPLGAPDEYGLASLAHILGGQALREGRG